ncbi:unnamed protein product [Brassicogethes aeneus]|nr:unnamed protein product [Brassicogethes aeneus]
MSHNYVENHNDFAHLEKLKVLTVLDLSNNYVEDALIVETLAKMPELRVLNLMGNPVIRKIPAYRKTMILACKNLHYLDDRPVFPRDRACAEAWKLGGMAEETAERQRWINRERAKIMASVDALINLRERRNSERTPDSGFGTSCADSGSEFEENRRMSLNTEEDSISEIEERAESPTYHYGRDGDNSEDDESSSSDSESSLNKENFMEDRQTTEDIEEYKDRIFDFTPKAKQVNKKCKLIEEINANEATTSKIEEIELQTIKVEKVTTIKEDTNTIDIHQKPSKTEETQPQPTIFEDELDLAEISFTKYLKRLRTKEAQASFDQEPEETRYDLLDENSQYIENNPEYHEEIQNSRELILAASRNFQGNEEIQRKIHEIMSPMMLLEEVPDVKKMLREGITNVLIVKKEIQSNQEICPNEENQTKSVKDENKKKEENKNSIFHIDIKEMQTRKIEENNFKTEEIPDEKKIEDNCENNKNNQQRNDSIKKLFEIWNDIEDKNIENIMKQKKETYKGEENENIEKKTTMDKENYTNKETKTEIYEKTCNEEIIEENNIVHVIHVKEEETTIEDVKRQIIEDTKKTEDTILKKEVLTIEDQKKNIYKTMEMIQKSLAKLDEKSKMKKDKLFEDYNKKTKKYDEEIEVIIGKEVDSRKSVQYKKEDLHKEHVELIKRVKEIFEDNEDIDKDFAIEEERLIKQMKKIDALYFQDQKQNLQHTKEEVNSEESEEYEEYEEIEENTVNITETEDKSQNITETDLNEIVDGIDELSDMLKKKKSNENLENNLKKTAEQLDIALKESEDSKIINDELKLVKRTTVLSLEMQMAQNNE